MSVAEPFEFDLGPELIVGGAFRLELDGRWSRQPGDQLYYVCLRDVECKGVPVAAVPNDAFLGAVHGLVRRTNSRRSLSYQALHEHLFANRKAMQRTVVKELSRQRAMMKCRTLIRCRRIDDLFEIAFPAYADDGRFRNELAEAVLALNDPVPLASYVKALDEIQIAFTEDESLCLGQLAIWSKDVAPFIDHVAALRVSFSEKLGDLFFDAGDYSCAMTCFSGAIVPDKVGCWLCIPIEGGSSSLGLHR